MTVQNKALLLSVLNLISHTTKVITDEIRNNAPIGKSTTRELKEGLTVGPEVSPQAISSIVNKVIVSSIKQWSSKHEQGSMFCLAGISQHSRTFPVPTHMTSHKIMKWNQLYSMCLGHYWTSNLLIWGLIKVNSQRKLFKLSPRMYFSPLWQLLN